MKQINVLSLFDGMACLRIALEKTGIPVGYYGASEIEKAPIMVAMHNFPDIDPLGDVCNLNPAEFRDIDLIAGGSPCQALSRAGKGLGMVTSDGQIVDSLPKYEFLKAMGYTYDNKRSLKYFSSSTIFWEFVRLYRGIKKYNPNVKFLLENVVNTEWESLITKELGVEPIRINSSVVIPQNRDRFYWTNIHYIPIQGDNPTLDSIIPDAISGAGSRGVKKKGETKYTPKLTVRKDGLANCLTAGGGKGCRKYLSIDNIIKDISIEEAEELQTVPAGYTDVPGVSEHQRFKMLGNGWTIDVIAHILSGFILQPVRKYPVWSNNS